jgi:hypothetical protein
MNADKSFHPLRCSQPIALEVCVVVKVTKIINHAIFEWVD